MIENSSAKVNRLSWVRRRQSSAILFVVVTAAFAASFGNEFIYDDHEVILKQPAPRSVTDVARYFAEPHFVGLPYYRPITRATLLVQKAIHGENPLPFHLFNAALMGCVAVLAFEWLRHPVFELSPRAAFLVALIFGVHPAASSCVYAIASGRETLMPAVFILAACCAWAKRGKLWHVVSLTACAAALLCKEQAAVLPVLLALLDLFGLSALPAARGAWFWLRRYAALLPIMAGYFAIRHALFGGGQYEIALWGDPITPLLSYAFALQTILAPFNSLVYEPSAAAWFSWPRLVFVGCAVLGFVFLTSRTTSATRKRICFWAGWFIVVQLPTANLLKQEAPFDERYVALASLGLIAAVATLASAAWSRAVIRRLTTAVGAAVALASLAVSVHRAGYFRNDMVFAKQWLSTDANSAEARHLFAWTLHSRGETEQAMPHFLAAVRINPNFAEAHHNLGAILALNGDAAGAAYHFSEVLRIMPAHPEAHYNLGILLASQGQTAAAEVHFRAALRADPRYVDAYNNLGVLLARQARLAEATDLFSEALRIAPDAREIHENIGQALERQGRRDEAAVHFARARALASPRRAVGK